jgi:MipA family protein
MACTYHPRSGASTRHSGVARLVALAVLLGGAVSGAMAQQQGHEGPQGTQWGLGIGVISKQDAYKGIKRDTQAVPVLRFENEYVEFFGLGLEVKLPSQKLGEGNQIKFGLVGEYDMSGYEAEDTKKTPILAGMTERKGGLWAGARATWETDFISISAEMTADASGKSKGRKFSLGLEKEFHLGERTMLTPYITAHRLDNKYVDYYYGVRAAEATAGRASYIGKGGVNVDIGLRAMHQFDNHHSMLLDVGMTRLAKQIKDSPIVGRSSTSQVILGYVYNF